VVYGLWQFAAVLLEDGFMQGQGRVISPDEAVVIINVLVAAGVPPSDLLDLVLPAYRYRRIHAAASLNRTKVPQMSEEFLFNIVVELVRKVGVMVFLAFDREGDGVSCILAIEHRMGTHNMFRFHWADEERPIVVQQLWHKFSQESDLECSLGLTELVISRKAKS